MAKQKIVGHTILSGQTDLPSQTDLLGQTHISGQTFGQTKCSVVYNKRLDAVEVAVGGTSLRLQADHFIVLHEMMRKAAAKIVMQTKIHAIGHVR